VLLCVYLLTLCRGCVVIIKPCRKIQFMPNATTSLFINKHSTNSKGKCSISVRVTFERVKRYYPTGITLSEDDFEKVKGDRPRKEFKDIALKLQSFEKKAADIIDKMLVFTFAAFEKLYYTNQGAKNCVDSAFKDYATELRYAGRIGTALSYECAQNSIKKFAPDIKFADITPNLLHKYEKWMLSKDKSITTVGIYLRSLRTLFNNAIADGILTKEYYPFGKKRYEIPTSNNIKKALTLNDIAKVYYYKTKEGSTSERAKDYWMFMYLCNGINIKDMCLLKYENIKGEMLEFERAKTARTKRNVEPIRIPLSDDAKIIINKWGNKKKDDKTFVFPVLKFGITLVREKQLVQQLTKLVNSHMKTIAEELKIDSKLTTYAARHSFATILQRSGASTEFISEALGHSNVSTTQNYLAGFEDDTKKEITKALTAFKQA
jgi:integrase/recombinase XerD